MARRRDMRDEREERCSPSTPDMELFLILVRAALLNICPGGGTMRGESPSSPAGGGTASTVSIVAPGPAPKLIVRLRTLRSSFSSLLLLASSARASSFCRSMMLSAGSPALWTGAADCGGASSSSVSFSGRYCLQSVLPRRAMLVWREAKLMGLGGGVLSRMGEVGDVGCCTTPKEEDEDEEREELRGLRPASPGGGVPSLTAREACSWRNCLKWEGEISGWMEAGTQKR